MSSSLKCVYVCVRKASVPALVRNAGSPGEREEKKETASRNGVRTTPNGADDGAWEASREGRPSS